MFQFAPLFCSGCRHGVKVRGNTAELVARSLEVYGPRGIGGPEGNRWVCDACFLTWKQGRPFPVGRGLWRARHRLGTWLLITGTALEHPRARRLVRELGFAVLGYRRDG